MAAPVADSADSAALGARVPAEPALPARRVQARQPVLAGLLLRLAVLPPTHLAVLVRQPVPADPLREGRPVLAHLVLESAVAVDLLLSRQSCSAAMAGITP